MLKWLMEFFPFVHQALTGLIVEPNKRENDSDDARYFMNMPKSEDDMSNIYLIHRVMKNKMLLRHWASPLPK